ncbi:hypothetical protein G114_01664 [Aeromonas diversa CDC 2478-85]|uniref:HNH nuclease domain-containing protein n=1 Tax=Aeromonas diversa CDC 2478-85 TaxID=1268237 RepID=N9VQZ4_9GAMM|nr:HNH endonuclease [Aeromonas diversa]ENY73721.1 hypothetical protein G114_01664 [Aeromonas diversa CDC 2478-85]
MIKLQRAPAPPYLSAEKVAELTAEFKSSGKSVWNQHHIKEPLLASSFGKCAYCECPLETESNYMEVEHFEDKKNNPEKVVDWENLLPSCKKCNGSKGAHDVVADPIVNPYRDDPKEHLALRLYRLRGISEIGVCTIQVTNLNHSDRLVFSRYKIGEKISELIETAFDRWQVYQEAGDTRSKNRLLGVVEGLLKECVPQASYAASTATMLLTDSSFLELIDEMKAASVWSEDLENLLQNALPIVLDCA